MKKNVVWILGIVVVVVGIIWFANRPGVETSESVLEEEGTASPSPSSSAQAKLVVPLIAQNDSQITGTATLTQMANGATTLVRLDYTHSPDTTAQPAHIHAGSCAKIGGIVYPLNSAVKGVSETTINTKLADIITKLPLALNVHKSEAQLDMYVACGDLKI